MFYEGQKVVCIVDESMWLAAANFVSLVKHFGSSYPREGRVYVVSGITACPGCGQVALYLVGQPAGCAYDASGFRPVVDAEMEKLAEIAAKPPELVDEPESELDRLFEKAAPERGA